MKRDLLLGSFNLIKIQKRKIHANQEIPDFYRKKYVSEKNKQKDF
jgi:hypothetical protein